MTTKSDVLSEQFIEALLRTYQAIAVEVSGSDLELAELCIDAGRLGMYGGNPDAETELSHLLEHYSYAEVLKECARFTR